MERANERMPMRNYRKTSRMSLLAATAVLVVALPLVASFVLTPGSRAKHYNTAIVTAAKKKNWDDASLKDFCAEQEARAIAATESWIVDATGFLEPDQSLALTKVLGDRADVDFLVVGKRRQRCVFCNPDLGYDAVTADADYVSYLKIDNVALSQCDPWPNILTKIGLNLESVGDVVLVENESTVYLAVDPESEKICSRLLPKELPGTGVTVSKLTKEELDTEMATVSDEIIVEDMEVQRVDKRKQ